MFFRSQKSKFAQAAGRKKSQPGRSPYKQLGVEPLEQRSLMATLATFDFADHVLRITGTQAADNIAITQIAGTVQVPGAAIKVLDHDAPLFDTGSVLHAAYGVQRIIVTALGGDDTVRNTVLRTGLWQYDMFLRDLPMTVYGGEGDDTVYGGEAADLLFGQWGKDMLMGNGGADQIYGGTEDDLLYGGWGNDSLYGQTGHDSLYGDADADQLFGGADNDNLYGGGGSDTLRGEAGNDGLYGGMGQDTLWGGGAAVTRGTKGELIWGAKGFDRYLVQLNEPNPGGVAITDTIRDFDNWNDAQIKFSNSPAIVNAPMGGQTGLFSFAAGNWTEADIQRMDVAFGNLHQTTGNTRLLKTATKGELSGFLAVGAQTAGNITIGGWNGGGQIVIVNPARQSDTNLRLTVYHEIAHNWDDVSENKYASTFRANSGWMKFPFDPSALGLGGWFTASSGKNSDGSDDNWYYVTAFDVGFAREYGKTNPSEDMATTWEAYFTNRFHGGATQLAAIGLVGYQPKWDTLDSLFSDLRLQS